MRRRFRVSGTVLEQETGRPLADLIVRAFDKDPVFDDLLGFATTDESGRFEIRFGETAFRDVVEKRPDVYLRIYDGSGLRLLHETIDSLRRNASEHEVFRIVISGTRLVPPRSRS